VKKRARAGTVGGSQRGLHGVVCRAQSEGIPSVQPTMGVRAAASAVADWGKESRDEWAAQGRKLANGWFVRVRGPTRKRRGQRAPLNGSGWFLGRVDGSGPRRRK
jgi:hypothetical protein